MTITERCADPEFQKFISRIHPRWWKGGADQYGMNQTQTAVAIIRALCGPEPNEHHPEYLALVNAFDRERVKVADLHASY